MAENVEANSDFYDRDARRYERDRFEDRYGRIEHARLRSILDTLLPESPVGPVLEIGCGTGRVTRELVRHFDELVIVDLSAEMLKATRQSLQMSTVDLEAHLASVYDLSSVDKTFNTVVCINVFSHIDDPLLALQEIKRVMMPGGRLLVSTPNLYSLYLPAGLWVNWRGKAIRQNVYSHWPSPREMRRHCVTAGLEVESVAGLVNVPRAVRRLPLLPEVGLLADRVLSAAGRTGATLAPWLLWLLRNPE